MAIETKKCTTTEQRLVRWSVVYLETGLEVAFPEREEMVDACLSESEVQTQLLCQFIERLPETEQPPLWREKDFPPAASGGMVNQLPPEAGRFLRVYIQSLAVYPTETWDFEAEQIEVLERIRDAIGEKTASRVRLPPGGQAFFALDPARSRFGDEFVNFPPFLGQRPEPGQTYLTGWVEVLFKPPQGDYAEFFLFYFGTGTPVTITWGGGQQFNFWRTRTFPLALLPDGKPAFNTGRLDLRTGDVDEIRIFATFQGTTIGATDRPNRIPYAFPYMFPPPTPPPGFVPPPGYQPPPPLPVFAKFKFNYDRDRSITGLELHSETLAPVGLFPSLGLFPGYSFGPDGEFHFANPTQCLAGTPPADCPNDDDNPDGILTSVSVVFHPHIDLVTSGEGVMPGEEPQPPLTPQPIALAGLVEAEGRLYLIGGASGGGITGEVWVLGGGGWEPGPPLPRPVAAAQVAALGGRVYVLGGWTDLGRAATDAVQVLDIASGQWQEQSRHLPVAVASAAAAAMGDRMIIIVGGRQSDGSVSSAVQILDVAASTWRQGQSASLPVTEASAVALDRQVLVMGGRTGGGQVTRRTTVYDPARDQWGLGPDTVVPVYAAAACRLGETVYLVGGRLAADDQPPYPGVQQLALSSALPPPDFAGLGGAWRDGLPQPLPAAASSAAVLDGVLYVAGGATLPADQPLPAGLSDVVQVFHPTSGWSVDDEQPVFTAAGVLNAGGLAIQPRLAPGALAVLLGSGLAGAPGPDAVHIRVGGKDAKIVAASPHGNFVYFQVPGDVAPGNAQLELTRPGSARQAPTVTIPILAAAPGLMLFTWGEVLEPAYLGRAPMLACNEDGSLNCASQPAVRGSVVALWATGLGKNPAAAAISVEVGGRAAQVQGLAPAPPIFPGVYLVRVRLANNVPFASNVPVVLKSGGVA